MKHTLLAMAAILATMTLLAGCASVFGGGGGEKNYTSVHDLMYAMDDANKEAMSKHLGDARDGADDVVELSEILMRDDIVYDQEQFLTHARTLNAAALQLQSAIKTRDWEQIGNAQAVLVKNCSDCHADYRK